MRHTLFFLFLLIYAPAVAQYTLIPDQNFEWFLIRNGYDSGSLDGKVLTSNINTITKLDFVNGSQNFIATLKGIEDFTALRELIIIDGSLLTSLDVSKNIALTTLICSRNKLTSLDVSKNIALTELDCSFNEITNINLSGCQALEIINCSFNKLISLDVSNSLLLKTLGCANNILTSLNTSKNINLGGLSCDNNQIKNLDISKNITLFQLICSNNNLSNIDVTNNPKLLIFGCDGNQLTNLDISQNVQLTYLNCSANQLINLDTLNNIYLSEFWCINNQIISLDISKNINLLKLFCYDNKLTNLNTSQNLQLNILYCHNNLITRLDVSLNNNLGIFRCANNQLTYLDIRNSNSWNWWNDTSYWTNNPNLKCIYVLNANFFNFHYSSRKDNTANYIDEPVFTTSVQTVCSKQNPTLKDVITNRYNTKWFDSLLGGNELAETTLLIEGKTYYAMNTAGSCESLRIPIKITLQPISAPLGISPQNLCNIKNPTLDNLNVIGASIQWYDAASGGNLLPNSALLINGSTYYASQTQNSCESARIPILVNLQNIIEPTTTSPQIFCIQQNANLSSIAITGQNIKWYDALTNGNFLPNTTVLQNGLTYYASQTINGCESERTPILINIQNTATPIAISPQTFCASQNPTLNTLAITGTAIKWYDRVTAGNILADTTPLQDGKIYYATQTLNNCESPTRLPVTISLISTLPANNYEEQFCDDLNDGAETTDLSSYNSKIISNTTNYSFTYYKSISGAQNETATDKIVNFSSYKLVLSVNKIYARINSNTPCYAVAELKLTLFSKPIINIQDIVPICEDKTITIDAGAGFDDYLWSNGAKTQSITIKDPGNFWVTVTDDYDTISCSSTKNFEVKKSNKATISSLETKDWTDNDNVIIVNIASSSSGDYEYSIDGVNYQTSNQFTGLNSGKYTITVKDKNGCGTTPPYEVYLLMFPKFFTPNGDGYNDTWKIKFSDIEAGLTIKIFDRYGKLLKNLITNTDSWDGTFNGTNLPADDYWFVVTRANGQEYKGHFSLKR